jgi:hypothetical protein
MTGPTGPPTRDSRPSAASTASDNGTVPPNKRLCWVAFPQNFPQDTRSQLRRRREASSRMVRLRDCCGASDPLACRCHNPVPPLSENALHAWRAAIQRTLPIGPPLVPLEVLQRLWRNGGADRELAERVWELTGGVVT